MSKLNILFATMWGNAEDVAKHTEELAKNKGIETTVRNESRPNRRFKTNGNGSICNTSNRHGDFPTNGEAFWDLLSQRRTPNLNNQKYSVCALGDSPMKYFVEQAKN